MFKKFLVVALYLLYATSASATTVVAFDFENATPGDSTVAASTTASVISGAEFGGSKSDSRVVFNSAVGSNRYASSLFPGTDGGWFLNMSFTTSQQLNLDLLSFTAGQNDCSPCGGFFGLTPRGPYDFDILLSPVNASTPTGLRNPGLSGYSLLDTVSVPYGFAVGDTPVFNVDLSTLMLGPGTYHLAFAASSPSGIITQTTALFMDDISLTASVVPIPAAAWLFGTALIGLVGFSRRRQK